MYIWTHTCIIIYIVHWCKCECVFVFVKEKKMVLIGLSWQNQDLLFDNRPLIYLFIYGSLEKKNDQLLDIGIGVWFLIAGRKRSDAELTLNKSWKSFLRCLEFRLVFRDCSGIALILLWRCSDVALTLLWNGPEVAVEEMVAETGHGVTLKWRQVSADVALKRLWDCPETAPERLCIVNLFQWHFHTRRCLVANDKISFSFPLVLSVHLFIDFF